MEDALAYGAGGSELRRSHIERQRDRGVGRHARAFQGQGAQVPVAADTREQI